MAPSRATVSFALRLLATAAVVATTAVGHAATLVWKGHTWQLTSGGMAGVCQGDPANVTVDGDGYLHLRLSHNGSTWSAAELFTTDELGFGTYQWQIAGRIDTLDPNVVLGLFPYGPQAGIGADGTNEIDIEFSRWGYPTGPNGDFTDYPASGTTIGEHSFTFSLNAEALFTTRFTWSTSSITSSLLGGLVPLESSTGSLETWEWAPPQPMTNIPQHALPLGMNLWCFEAPPSDGTPVELVVRDFVFVPEGAASGTGGAAGESGAPSGNAAGTGAGGRSGGAGGGAVSGGAPTTGGNGTAGSAVAQGGSAEQPGAASGGTAGRADGGMTTAAGAGAGGTLAHAGANGSGGASETGGRSAVAGRSASGTGGGHSAGCGCATARARAPGFSAAAWAILAGAFVCRRRRR